tara:strand:+ start:412 stop:579 length:168 start_codon:yes stop_codon:yes gene_type:complete
MIEYMLARCESEQGVTTAQIESRLFFSLLAWSILFVGGLHGIVRGTRLEVTDPSD